jgi:uncharacterized membrane protein YhaH (DUF805 family)
MNEEGIATLLVLTLYVLVLIVPAVKVLRRVGFSGWWSILIFVPLVNIIALWIFAFGRWPIDERIRQALEPRR